MLLLVCAVVCVFPLPRHLVALQINLQTTIMKAKSQNQRNLLFAGVTLAFTLTAGAEPIAVPNPGFEQLAKVDGNDNFNEFANNRDVWRHWIRTENGGPLRVWNPGASGVTFQGVLGYGFGGNAPEGNNVQLVYSRYSLATGGSVLLPAPQWDGLNYFSAACVLLDGTIGNPVVPAAPFDPTKVYTLTASVGKPPLFVTNSGAQNSTDPRRSPAAVWHGYALQLAAGGSNQTGATFGGRVDGGTIVSQDSNSRVVPVDGFRQVTTTYFPNPADADMAGQFLQIRLAALDNPADLAMTGYVAFDDVKLEEFAAPALAHWDLNDTAAGAGGASPSGIWNAENTFWTATADGTGAGAAWTAGQTAVFSAGADATGAYVVTVDGTQSIGGLNFKNGNVTLTGGTALELAGIGMVDVASGLTATVTTAITQASAGLQLAKTGTGTLVLSGANTYSGGTTVLDGTLRLGASNVLADTSVVTVTGRSTGTATFDLNGKSDTVGGLVLGGSAEDSAAVVSTGAGTLTLGGDVSYVNAVGNGINPLGATISGNLNLGSAARAFQVNNSGAAADLTVSADINGAVAMTKTGKGILVLSGNNAGATGGMSIEEGVVQFASAAAINGTARDVTVATPGVVAFGPSFGAGNIPSALASRIVASSDGIIAADNHAATDFDFNAAGLSGAYLGAVGDVTYTGTVTPNGTTYRLGGGGGTLTIDTGNALTGSGRSLSVGGKLTLMAANNYDGGTSLLGGTVFPGGPVVLTLGHDGALGSGPLTFQSQPNASTAGTIRSSDDSARTVPNVVVLNGGVNTSGTGDLNFANTTPIALTATRLFYISNPATRFAAAFTGTGGITMDFTGPGTLVLAGNNSYTGNTLINGGILVLTGDNSAMTGTVTISSRFGVLSGVVIGHDKALGSGTFTIAAVPATVAAQGTRTVANAVAGNADFSLVGTDALTFGGLLTLNNPRVITNSNTTNPTTFAGGITGANRNLTLAGDGETIISGAITTGTGTLIKNGAGTLTLQGVNTYSGNTTVNTGCLALVGGSQNSAITVGGSASLGFTPGLPTTSTKALTLQAGAKIRIIGTPTLASYTLFTTTGSITGTPELLTPVPGYELVKEEGDKELKLVAVVDADYLAWVAKFPGSDLGNPAGDFDGDGMTNDEERLFGLNPTLGSSANPFAVPLNPATGAFSFTRRDPALSKYLYSAWTSTNLLTWDEDLGAVFTPGATVAEIQTVGVQLSPGLLTAPRLFLRLRADKAPPPPPLLVADFEANDGGFTVATTSGTAWAYGDPESPTAGGGAVLTGNGNSAKCWGTNLTGPYSGATDTALRSPVIDLTGVTAANLSFALAIDAPAGHTLAVSVIDASDNVIATITTIEDADINTAAWQAVGPLAIPAAALGQPVRLQWRFVGSGDGNFLGAYIDDVTVGEP